MMIFWGSLEAGKSVTEAERIAVLSVSFYNKNKEPVWERVFSEKVL